MENPGIDPGTSRMLSERSTIWANPPHIRLKVASNLEIKVQFTGRQNLENPSIDP